MRIGFLETTVFALKQIKAFCLGLTIYPLPLVPLMGYNIVVPKPMKYNPALWEDNPTLEIMETVSYQLAKYRVYEHTVYVYIESGEGSFSSPEVEREFFQKLVWRRWQECFT